MELKGKKSHLDWQSKCDSAQSKLAFLLEKDVLSDVVFVVGEIEKESFFAHKFVLMIGSSVMKNMFWGKKNLTEISVPDVSPIIFRTVLKFLYMHKVEVDWDDTDRVMDLFEAACKYRLCNLAAQCNKVLIDSMTEKTVIPMYEIGILRNHKELSDYSFDFLCRNGKSVLTGIHPKKLRLLSKDNLKRLVQSDALNINETDLFRIIIKWAKSLCEVDQKNVPDLLKDIVPYIRFMLMTPADVTMVNSTHGVLSKDNLLLIHENFLIPNHLRSPNPSLEPFSNATPRNRFWIAERFLSTETRSWICKPKWQYISFQVDQPIAVVGIGLYGESSSIVRNGAYFSACKPYSYEVRMYENASQNLKLAERHTLENPGRLVHVKFENPVSITRRTWYTIAAKINSNAESFIGKGGHGEVKLECSQGNVVFSFRNNTNLKLANEEEPEQEGEERKENNTNVLSGEIPEIAFKFPVV